MFDTKTFFAFSDFKTRNYSSTKIIALALSFRNVTHDLGKVQWGIKTHKNTIKKKCTYPTKT